METEALAMAQEIDFSLLALFARATLTVKLVMLMLAVASIWSWSIIVQKFITYRMARREASIFDRAFWSGEPLDELFEKIGSAPDGASEKIFAAGMLEWRRSHRQDGGLIAGAQARIDRSMDVAIAKEAERLNSGLGVLATTGATAPFIGLFGTVWGIYHALLAIGTAGQATIDKVAGPIGESLIMTALGLAVAIPAVLGYNALVRGNKGVLHKLNRFAHDLHAYFVTGARVSSGGAANVVPMKKA